MMVDQVQVFSAAALTSAETPMRHVEDISNPPRLQLAPAYPLLTVDGAAGSLVGLSVTCFHHQMEALSSSAVCRLVI
jgi:hypothetical protein